MYNFLIIDKNTHGAYIVSDSITNEKRVYYFCSLRDAIRAHREQFKIKYKHLTKIYLY